MLIRLHITNFALIESLEFAPESGLNVITGETGAGKSLLIDALGALIGKRLGKEIVRTGCERAVVEGVFDSTSSVVSVSELEALGIVPDEDDLLYITREIHAEGRNIVRINGTMIPLSVLKGIGSRFLDIHGQHDQQAIFQVNKHIDMLDRYAGDDLQTAIDLYTVVLNDYVLCVNEIKQLGSDPVSRSRREELLRYQIDELESAAFFIGEEEDLFEKKKRITGIGKIRDCVSSLDRIFSSEDSHSAFSKLHEAESLIAELSNLRDSYKAVSERMGSVVLELDAIEEDLTDLNREMENEDYSLEDIEKRLDLLFRFKSKYGITINDMNLYLSNARNELEYLVSSESRLLFLHKQRLSLEKTLLENADAVHLIRAKYSEELSREIVRELTDLGMQAASFIVSMQKRPKDRFFSKNGYDDVAFMFSANRGEPERPLEKIASGGEASRIMLAIKTILSNADSMQTLVFDEIDAGISGQTASIVSSKMKRLAKSKQILCVTHMAQIAAGADNNYFISKSVENKRTITVIKQLDQDDKKKEVARLLSGESDDFKSLDLSEQMIRRRNDN